jgi:hypothetical protein
MTFRLGFTLAEPLEVRAVEGVVVQKGLSVSQVVTTARVLPERHRPARHPEAGAGRP